MHIWSAKAIAAHQGDPSLYGSAPLFIRVRACVRASPCVCVRMRACVRELERLCVCARMDTHRRIHEYTCTCLLTSLPCGNCARACDQCTAVGATTAAAASALPPSPRPEDCTCAERRCTQWHSMPTRCTALYAAKAMHGSSVGWVLQRRPQAVCTGFGYGNAAQSRRRCG